MLLCSPCHVGLHGIWKASIRSHDGDCPAEETSVLVRIWSSMDMWAATCICISLNSKRETDRRRTSIRHPWLVVATTELPSLKARCKTQRAPPQDRRKLEVSGTSSIRRRHHTIPSDNNRTCFTPLFWNSHHLGMFLWRIKEGLIHARIVTTPRSTLTYLHPLPPVQETSTWLGHYYRYPLTKICGDPGCTSTSTPAVPGTAAADFLRAASVDKATVGPQVPCPIPDHRSCLEVI